jgi:Protein of unknown function (DUF2924)
VFCHSPVRSLAQPAIPALLLDNVAAQSVHGVDAMEKDSVITTEGPIERVMRMDIPSLQRLHRSLFGGDCTVRHILYLRRKIAWEIQARAKGGLTEESRQHALGIAWQTTLRTRAQSQR